MKQKYYLHTAIVLTLTILLSCSKSWLEENPPHLISTSSLYTTRAGFETGLNGLYALVREEREGEKSTPNQLRFELSITGTDNMVSNRQDRFALLSAGWKNLNNSQNKHLGSHFSWLYSIVNAANTIINQGERRTDVDWSGGGAGSEANKNRILGEARAMRAWAYRHLTFMWGEVPLSLEESLGSTIRTDWERSPISEVRKQIIKDLMFAEANVPVEPIQRGKISRGAVQHYLSEMYLVINKPDSALFWAEKVINTPQYQLITDRYGINKNKPGVAFMDMFLEGNSNREEGNKEALWVWQWAYGISGKGSNIMRRWHGSEYNKITIGNVSPLAITIERGGRAQARVSLTKWAIDNYEPSDDRGSYFAIRKFFILKDAAGNAPSAADKLPAGYNYGDTIKLNWSQDISPDGVIPRRDWPYSRKFDGTSPDNPSDPASNQDQPYLRLADTYLLKAEAEFRLGRSDDAAKTINVLRRRAHASDISASDITIDFILDERSRELLFEENRRYTLLRTGKWLERTRLYNHNGGQNIEARDTLFPIPQAVIDANLTKKMEQNNGFD